MTTNGMDGVCEKSIERKKNVFVARKDDCELYKWMEISGECMSKDAFLKVP